ncbi:MAG: FAD-linked oxidase C-terminal domain-containing protein [Pseudomonadota bacterium]
MISEDTFQRLRAIFGEAVSRSAEDLYCHGYDATGLNYSPHVVAWPRAAAQVARALALATERRFPVVARGAGSGLSGGALPVRGGLVLAMSRLNRILEIDTRDMLAVVEPGVVCAELQRQAGKEGLFYPPDPASLSFSTLGGNVAENAGGPRAVKYGVTRDYVLGLEVALPTGELINCGVRTLKGVVGYDLTRLLVGSEGTLAVITRITLRLIPRPQARHTLLAWFRLFEEAAQAAAGIRAAGLLPATIEYMDRRAIACAEDYLKIGLPLDMDALLLMDCDGRPSAVREETERVRQVCLGAGAVSCEVAESEERSEQLWQARRAVSPAVFRLGKNKTSEDIVVPCSRLADIVRTIERLGRRFELVVLSYGHAGDGNLHVNFMVDRSNPEVMARAERAVKELFEETLRLGGTISGEHGVGLTKAPYVDMELSQASRLLMRRIKEAFDPAGILNPGKMGL